MKRFLLNVALVTITTLACCCVSVAVKVRSCRSRVETVCRLDDACEVVILGSSDAGCSFVEGGRYGTRVFWNSGASFLFNAMRLRAIFTANGGLKNVKVVLAPFNQHYPSWYKDESRTLRTFRTLYPSIWMYWDEMLPEFKIKCLVDVFQHVERIGCMSEKIPGETLPWTSRDAANRAEYLQGQWREHYAWLNWSPSEIATITQRAKDDILRLKNICDLANARLVLINTPFTSDYWAGVPNAAMAWLDDIRLYAARNGVVCYDYKTSMPDDKFRDDCHLLLGGAKLFTEKVYHGLEKDGVLK